MDGENCPMRCIIMYTPYLIMLGWSSHRGLCRRDM